MGLAIADMAQGWLILCDPSHPSITEVEAEDYLARDLQTALAARLCYCPVLATEPSERRGGSQPSWISPFDLGAGRLQPPGPVGTVNWTPLGPSAIAHGQATGDLPASVI